MEADNEAGGVYLIYSLALAGLLGSFPFSQWRFHCTERHIFFYTFLSIGLSVVVFS